MPSQQNIQQLEEVTKRLETTKSAALLQYQGLTAGQISDLRAKVKDLGGEISVVKNTLLTRALSKIGIKIPETLTGPTAVVYCDQDEVAPLKEVDAVNKDKEKTSFKYGIYNQKLLLADELKKFLSLPSKSALISQLLGGLKNPIERLSYALRFNQTQLVLTLKAIANKK